jgi:hypothetical protein
MVNRRGPWSQVVKSYLCAIAHKTENVA